REGELPVLGGYFSVILVERNPFLELEVNAEAVGGGLERLGKGVHAVQRAGLVGAELLLPSRHHPLLDAAGHVRRIEVDDVDEQPVAQRPALGRGGRLRSSRRGWLPGARGPRRR